MDERLMGAIRDRLVTATRRASLGPRAPIGALAGKDKAVAHGQHGRSGGTAAMHGSIMIPTVARSLWAFAMLGQYDEELFGLLAAHGKVQSKGAFDLTIDLTSN